MALVVIFLVTQLLNATNTTVAKIQEKKTQLNSRS